MKRTLAFLFLAFATFNSNAETFWMEKANLYYQEWKYGVDQEESYDFQACHKFASEEDREYFITCRQDELAPVSELEQLSAQTGAIAIELVKDEFLSGLKSDVLAKLKDNYDRLLELRECLEKDLNTPKCAQQKLGLLAGMKSGLPKLRALAAQKDMPGKIYSPVKPERFQRRIEHGLSGIKAKEISEEEASFLAEHTDSLEERFRADTIKNLGFEGCMEPRACPDKEPIIDTHVSKMFQEQNKRYQKEYASLAASNPLLTLLNSRGDESERELLADAKRSLVFLEQKAAASIRDIEAMEGDEREKLLALTQGVDNRLALLDNQVYCDAAQKLKGQMEMGELRTDLLIGAGTLIGGGVCAFTMGAGCVLAVAVGGEALNLALTQNRLNQAENFFYSGEGDADKLSERRDERALALYLAPLALVGEGVVGSGFKIVRKSAARAGSQAAGRSRRLDVSQRQLIDDIDRELGGKRGEILQALNPGNKHGLTPADETYLAGIVSLLKKKLKKENPDLSETQIDETIKVKARDLIRKCQEGK